MCHSSSIPRLRYHFRLHCFRQLRGLPRMKARAASCSVLLDIRSQTQRLISTRARPPSSFWTPAYATSSSSWAHEVSTSQVRILNRLMSLPSKWRQQIRTAAAGDAFNGGFAFALDPRWTRSAVRCAVRERSCGGFRHEGRSSEFNATASRS